MGFPPRKIPAKAVKPPVSPLPPPQTAYPITGTTTGRAPVEPAKPEPVPTSAGRSLEHGYRVQIRDLSFNPHRPVQLHDGIVGPDWRDLEFKRGNNPAGVPFPDYGYTERHGLLTFKGAMAMAWTTMAQSHHRSLECRLVKFSLIVEFKVFRKGVCMVPKHIGGDSLEALRGTPVDETIKMEDES